MYISGTNHFKKTITMRRRHWMTGASFFGVKAQRGGSYGNSI
jgi:hypothetical protein